MPTGATGAAAPDLFVVLLDSTAVSAAGVLKNKEAEPALNRSRDGFSTKIYVLADRRGRSLRVTGGRCYAALAVLMWDFSQIRVALGKGGWTFCALAVILPAIPFFACWPEDGPR